MYWAGVRRRVDADPELKRLEARRDAILRSDGAGSGPYRRADRSYRARYDLVHEQARLDQTAEEVDRERADKAAYMREYRANKRAIREAVDARRRPASVAREP
jgi:hypothetical protein